MVESFYRGADACLLVFDVNVESTFNNLSNWKSEFLVKAFPPNSNDFPFVVVGNKIGKNFVHKIIYKKKKKN